MQAKQRKKTITKLFFCLSVEIDYEPVGCYRDKRGDRALSRLVKNFRGSIDLWKDWPDMSSVIQKCAQEAFIQGYTMFGVQFYGECWSGENTQGYNKHGKSPDGCIHGVGKENANFIYRIPIPGRTELCFPKICSLGHHFT